MLKRNDFRIHQEHALEFVLNTRRCVLWLDMGLGKTAVCLTAISQLIKKFDVGRVLVVGPKRPARKVWKDEIKKWQHLNHLTIETMHGPVSQRENALNRFADIHTISFDNLEWLTNHYRKKGQARILKSNPWPWDMVIIDEASGFKNRETVRWKAMYRVIRETDRLIELTGSPAPNGLIDVWSPFFFIDFGKRLGTSLTAYRNRWFAPPDGRRTWKWKAFDHSAKQIHARLKDKVLSMREDDWLDLPPVLINPVTVELTATELKQYHRLAKEHWIHLGGKMITAANAGVAWGKCLQLANGACYFDDEHHFESFHEHKLEALRELLSASLDLDQPVMLMYSYWHDLVRIKRLFVQMGIKRWRKLDTEQDEDDWNAGEIDVLLLHPASGGHGLNLQEGGETIIWFGLNPSLELFNQANARLMGGLRRIGKKVILHIILAEGTVDDDVDILLDEKANIEDALFEATKRKYI